MRFYTLTEVLKILEAFVFLFINKYNFTGFYGIVNLTLSFVIYWFLISTI